MKKLPVELSGLCASLCFSFGFVEGMYGNHRGAAFLGVFFLICMADVYWRWFRTR